MKKENIQEDIGEFIQKYFIRMVDQFNRLDNKNIFELDEDQQKSIKRDVNLRFKRDNNNREFININRFYKDGRLFKRVKSDDDNSFNKIEIMREFKEIYKKYTYHNDNEDILIRSTQELISIFKNCNVNLIIYDDGCGYKIDSTNEIDNVELIYVLDDFYKFTTEQNIE